MFENLRFGAHTRPFSEGFPCFGRLSMFLLCLLWSRMRSGLSSSLRRLRAGSPKRRMTGFSIRERAGTNRSAWTNRNLPGVALSMARDSLCSLSRFGIQRPLHACAARAFFIDKYRFSIYYISSVSDRGIGRFGRGRGILRRPDTRK